MNKTDVMHPSTQCNAGYSLLEALVAVVVLAIGIIGFAMLQTTNIQSNAYARRVTEATVLLQEQIEILSTLPWGDPSVSDNNGNGGNATVGYGLNAVEAAADNSTTVGSYTISWNVADDIPFNNTKTIRLIATWTESQGGKNVTMDYIKAR